MINFVEISLHDYHHLQEHDQLDAMLAEGWTIIAHSVFTNLDNEPTERYTLHKADKPKDVTLIERLVGAETFQEKEDIYQELGQRLVAEGSS